MESRAPRTTYGYSIDSSDRIIRVSDAWLDFAAENDAPELTRSRVVGRTLWEFIEGPTTRDLYGALFEKIRSLASGVPVPFRCDAPDRYRFMELTLAPAADGVIELSGVLLREQRRRRVPVLERALQHADYSFPICSFCKRVFAAGEWLELEDAIARLGRFDSTNLPGLDQSVCEDCVRATRSGVGRSRPAERP